MACRTPIALVAISICLACAMPAHAASATHVTSFTVSPTHVVGGSSQRAAATVTVFIDPNEGTYFLPNYTSIGVQVRQENSAPNSYYYQCADYVPVGSTSMTCLLPLPLPVTTSQTITLIARAGNINYNNGNDPGMTATLTVDPAPPPTGTLRVTTNLAAASFTITGPATYTGTGTSFTQLAAPTGTYTITCNPVPGYLTPSPQLRVLTTGGTATFTRSYQLDLRVRAGTGAGPNDPTTETRKPGSSPVSATLPLGAGFFIQLTKSDLIGISSTFTLTQPVVNPALTEASLFSGAVVIEFNAAAAGDTKYFRAVHLGTELLTIRPTESSLPAVQVAITVSRPTALGSSPNQFDAALIDIGHKRGIPPQFLKGQISRESGFRADAYRYEPLSEDLVVFSSAGQNLRTKAPYSSYRLATSDGLSQGAGLIEPDIDPRSGYNIVVDGARRSILSTDTFVSALDIYETNVSRAHWDSANPVQADRVKKDPGLLRFTAQTPLAASYGLLQILYPTAIAPLGWSGIGGAKNPSYLFDTDANISSGGGSLALGSGYLRRIFRRANPAISLANPMFTKPDDFVAAFRRAFNFYNHAGSQGSYGADVLGRAASFVPQAATILQ